MPVVLDDVLLRLESEINADSDPLQAFKGVEAERVLEGVVRFKREAQVVRICQDLGCTPDETRRLCDTIKWRG